MVLLSLASCILSVSHAKSEARYRGYSGYRRSYNQGYFRGYSSYARPDYRHKVHHQSGSGYRKYGYKIVSPAPPAYVESDRAVPSPVKVKPQSRFSLDIDFPSEEKLAVIPTNKIDVQQKTSFPPPFPKRIQRPQNLPPSNSIPEPSPAVNPEPVFVQAVNPEFVPVPAVNPEPVPVPAVNPKPVPVSALNPKFVPVPAVNPEPVPVPAVNPEPVPVPAVPVLPLAVPAVPGRPILTDSSSSQLLASPSESVGSSFVPMPVPAVPGL